MPGMRAPFNGSSTPDADMRAWPLPSALTAASKVATFYDRLLRPF